MMREEVVSVMFCKYCGAQLPDGANFCSQCGKQLGSAYAVGNPPPAGEYIKPQYTDAEQTFQTFTQVQDRRAPETVSSVPGIKAKKTYNIGNFIYWAGCVFTLLALFLPYGSVEVGEYSQSISMIRANDGIFFLVLIIAAAAISFFRLNTGCVVLSFFIMLLVIFERIYTAGQLGSYVKFGLGSTFLPLGSTVMIASSAAALILWVRKKHKFKRQSAQMRTAGGGL